ncbi:hypothetical protein GC102_35185 [Paenibacillus sp. LMG 31460]|uniref:Uncharacterized protein n=1 Tax=Paenibacillus germinis TaxID=2654979 RepID=A0ABX1ZC74_9BACL|nr:glycosyltransferase family A protein [Paenibacillus germinis]NOU90932.1 hypothetical protein [Paenibacillus germinis]
MLDQSFTSFELIIISDSNDASIEAELMRLLQRDERICAVIHRIACGLMGLCLNEGLQQARRTYIAYQYESARWQQRTLEILLQNLVSLPEEALVYGQCTVNMPHGNELILGAPYYGLEMLSEVNYIGKNAVLHPKRFYDSHVVMRNWEDWDLWRRWASYYPMHYVHASVSWIDKGHYYCLGNSIPSDHIWFRLMTRLPRDEQLLPDNMYRYQIDSLTEFEPYLDSEHRQLIYEEKLLPWYREFAPDCANLPAAGPKTKVNMLTPREPEPCVENMEYRTGRYYYVYTVPTQHIDPSVMRMADLLLLHRSMNPMNAQHQKLAEVMGRPIVYILDDDILNLYKAGPSFHSIGPGTDHYAEITRQIACSDIVVTYSPLITESVAKINPRIIQARTNIPEWAVASSYNEPARDQVFRFGFIGG